MKKYILKKDISFVNVHIPAGAAGKLVRKEVSSLGYDHIIFTSPYGNPYSIPLHIDSYTEWVEEIEDKVEISGVTRHYEDEGASGIFAYLLHSNKRLEEFSYAAIKQAIEDICNGVEKKREYTEEDIMAFCRYWLRHPSSNPQVVYENWKQSKNPV